MKMNWVNMGSSNPHNYNTPCKVSAPRKYKHSTDISKHLQELVSVSVNGKHGSAIHLFEFVKGDLRKLYL